MIELPFPPSSLSGHNKGRRPFTAAEVAYLKDNYRRIVEDGQLADLATAMGRTKTALSSKARTLGLTDAKAGRRIAADAAKAKCTGVPKWATKPHPEGFKGKRHTPAARESSRIASNSFWSSLSAVEHQDRVNSNLKAAIAKNGRIGPIVNKRETTWKAGWREIGDKRHYFRSRWEANYARYLQWLKERGEILEWEYEPETFWFEAIKRGVRSYLPDFRIHELNGDRPLHEVKGWMDARSKTTLKRMAKYHPQEKIILIREKEYRAISRFAALVGGWE